MHVAGTHSRVVSMSQAILINIMHVFAIIMCILRRYVVATNETETEREIRCCLFGISTILQCKFKSVIEWPATNEMMSTNAKKCVPYVHNSMSTNPLHSMHGLRVCVCVPSVARMPNSDCCQLMLAVLFYWKCLRIHVRVPSH